MQNNNDTLKQDRVTSKWNAFVELSPYYTFLVLTCIIFVEVIKGDADNSICVYLAAYSATFSFSIFVSEYIIKKVRTYTTDKFTKIGKAFLHTIIEAKKGQTNFFKPLLFVPERFANRFGNA